MAKVVTFGEIMLRLSPPGHLRFVQANQFDAIYGGGESNVAVSLANFGIETNYVTRLPNNDIGQACLNYLRQYGVGTDHIIFGGDRLGIYFLENGAVSRGSKVVYDRAGSALSTVETNMINWDGALKDAEWFHWTGITPAISEGAAQVCLEGIKAAKKHGLIVSTDLNYRKKLWKWGKQPDEVMEEMVSLCDVVIGNEEDAEKVFNIHPPESDVTSGKLNPEKYLYVCEKLAEKFPNLKSIAITLRGSKSASHNSWSAVLWQDGEMVYGPDYEITHIVDRVGGGDSFMAGLIYGLINFGEDKTKAINFAVSASALKHTIFGDFNLVSVAEVEKLMSGDGSGRVSR
ncbi:MAG: sugar kinase [Chloroflexi bacterium]|jgi:2-dehydro-3-deoxygluconokinase|nr:sugar kinase [Chloroflexota bacterium]MBT4754781.1 sugar kinase [Chloroflexota bacterium]MBT6358785.1 sugar kinase [Chloroflexota bacterium]MBT6989920.1 sugar kinase [Chloroflexota bacterium]MBT7216880.1 sugar kinase [Chloroflexota bacterium]